METSRRPKGAAGCQERGFFSLEQKESRLSHQVFPPLGRGHRGSGRRPADVGVGGEGQLSEREPEQPAHPDEDAEVYGDLSDARPPVWILMGGYGVHCFERERGWLKVALRVAAVG